MPKLRLWAALLLLAIGFVAAADRAAAEEAQLAVTGGIIEITDFICQDSNRVDEVDFFIASVNMAEEGDCILAPFGSHLFGLFDSVGEQVDSVGIDGGFATFTNVAPGTYSISEGNSGATTEPFEVTDGSYTSVTHIVYTDEVDGPFPGKGGDGDIQIQHLICESEELAGTTQITVGSVVFAGDTTYFCEFGVGTIFDITPLVQNVEVEAAGTDAVQLTTSDDGFTPMQSLPMGDYLVAKASDANTSATVYVPEFTYTLVSVIDYVAPPEEPTEKATLTIHKAVCETGVGADIFEECHDHGVEDVTFWVNETEWTTDEDGVVTGEVEAGTVEIVEDEEVFADYIGAYVYCSEQGSGDVLIDTDAPDGAIAIEAESGDDIVCDWYNITKASKPPVDPDDDDDEEEEVTKLPSTGAGVTASDSAGMAFLLAGLMSIVAVAGLSALRTRRS